MSAPFAAADLVGDEGVARRGVGNAQQRLGEAHQRDALLAGKLVFVHQALHQPRRRPRAQALDQASRQRARLAGDRRRQLGRPQQARQALGLGSAIGGVDRGAPAVVAANLGGEGGKRPQDPLRGFGGAVDRGNLTAGGHTNSPEAAYRCRESYMERNAPQGNGKREESDNAPQ